MKFRLNVHKFKCTYCDLIFLVENQDSDPNNAPLDCPVCLTITHVVSMGAITIVEENEVE